MQIYKIISVIITIMKLLLVNLWAAKKKNLSFWLQNSHTKITVKYCTLQINVFSKYRKNEDGNLVF